MVLNMVLNLVLNLVLNSISSTGIVYLVMRDNWKLNQSMLSVFHKKYHSACIYFVRHSIANEKYEELSLLYTILYTHWRISESIVALKIKLFEKCDKGKMLDLSLHLYNYYKCLCNKGVKIGWTRYSRLYVTMTVNRSLLHNA